MWERLPFRTAGVAARLLVPFSVCLNLKWEPSHPASVSYIYFLCIYEYCFIHILSWKKSEKNVYFSDSYRWRMSILDQWRPWSKCFGISMLCPMQFGSQQVCLILVNSQAWVQVRFPLIVHTLPTPLTAHNELVVWWPVGACMCSASPSGWNGNTPLACRTLSLFSPPSVYIFCEGLMHINYLYVLFSIQHILANWILNTLIRYLSVI